MENEKTVTKTVQFTFARALVADIDRSRIFTEDIEFIGRYYSEKAIEKELQRICSSRGLKLVSYSGVKIIRRRYEMPTQQFITSAQLINI